MPSRIAVFRRAWVKSAPRHPRRWPPAPLILWFTGHGNGASLDTTTTIADGDQFQATSAPAGGFTAYDTTTPFRGSSAARFSAQATAGITYGEWGSSTAGLSGVGSNTLHYLRGRVRFPVLPPDTTGVPFLQILDSSGNVQGQLIGDINGKIKLADGAGTVLGTSTAAFTTSSWTDVGLAITTYGGAGVGQLEAKIYTSGLVTETLSGSADTLRSGGGNRVRMGMLRSLAFMTVDIQDMAWSPTAYPVLPGISVVESTTTTYASANTATITTGSFTPANNSLLVAYCSMGNGAAVASSLGAVTDSLSGSWTRLAGEASASGGVAEIWARDVVTGASMTVTYDPGGAGASGLDIIVKAYTQAAPVAQQPGATGVNAGGSSYSTSITTTKTGSIVAGALGRATDAQTVVANALTTILGQVNGSSGDTAALFRTTALTATPGATTVGFTNGAAGINRIALAEIVPPSGVSASAEAAGAASTAYDATVTISALAEQPAASGSAPDAATAVGANAEQPTAAGTGYDPAGSVVALPDTPATAGSAPDAQGSDGGVAGAATGTGAAFDVDHVDVTAGSGTPAGSGAAPDGAADLRVNAEQPSASGVAYDTTVSTTSSVNANAECPAATGAGLDAVAEVDGAAGSPTAVGGAVDANTALTVQAEAPSGSGAAHDTTSAAAASPDPPAAVGVASDAVPAVTLTAGSPVSAGAGFDAVGSVGALAGTAVDGVGTASDANTAITVNAEQPAATGVGVDATVSTNTSVNAPADACLGTGTAFDTSVTVTVAAEQPATAGTASTAGIAAAALTDAPTAVGAGADSSVAAAGNAEQPTGIGAALDAVAATGVRPQAPAAAGQSGDGSTAITVNAEQSTAVGAAYDPAVSTSSATNVAAGFGDGAGSAADATIVITINADLTVTTGSAGDGVAGVAAGVGQPAAAGSAYDTTIETGRAALAGSATGVAAALDVGAAAAAATDAALAVLSALDATVVVSSLVVPFAVVDSAGSVASTMDTRGAVLVGATGSTSLAESAEATGGPAYATGERESGATYTTGEAGW